MSNKISNDMPKYIVEILQYYYLLKKYPIRSMFFLFIFLFIFLIYNTYPTIFKFFKHDINTKILNIEVTQKEKIKLKHIFFASTNLIEIFYDIKNKEAIYMNTYKRHLEENFSALGFMENNLFKYNKDVNVIDYLNDYDSTRALFKGFIDREYSLYSSLYDAGLNLLVYIKSGENIYLEIFIKNWEKFKKNNDFIAPNFDTSIIKSQNDAMKIYIEILTWLKN